MNISMQKTFLIKACNFKEIAEGKGALEYLLLDEMGVERRVTATAEVGRFKKYKSVKAIYHRETPLVKALAKASVNQTIKMDFTKFNSKNPRFNTDLKGKKNRKKTQASIVLDSNYSGVKTLPDRSRLMHLFLISVFSFVVF